MGSHRDISYFSLHNINIKYRGIKIKLTHMYLAKKNIILIFILTTSYYFSFSQNITILDSINKTPLSYANVKYLNSDRGVYSNEKGVFTLGDTKPDSLLVSYIGYYPMRIKVSKLNDTIFLKPKVETLKEIFINSKIEEKVIGLRKKSNYFSSHMASSWEYAAHLKFNQNYHNVYIKNISFPIKKTKKIKNKDFKSVVRVNIYSINQDGHIGEKIYTSTPAYTPIDKSNTITFDVINELIQINNEMVIGIELIAFINKENEIQNDKNMYLHLPFSKQEAKEFSSKTYFKLNFSNKMEWIPVSEYRKLKKEYYLPISITLATYED